MAINTMIKATWMEIMDTWMKVTNMIINTVMTLTNIHTMIMIMTMNNEYS
jgi:hypothetical protein